MKLKDKTKQINYVIGAILFVHYYFTGGEHGLIVPLLPIMLGFSRNGTYETQEELRKEIKYIKKQIEKIKKIIK